MEPRSIREAFEFQAEVFEFQAELFEFQSEVFELEMFESSSSSRQSGTAGPFTAFFQSNNGPKNPQCTNCRATMDAKGQIKVGGTPLQQKFIFTFCTRHSDFPFPLGVNFVANALHDKKEK